MSFTVEFQEDYKSREIDISDDSFQQTVRFLICGEFLANAVDQPPYGKNDDVVALQAAYSILPTFFLMPTYAGYYIPLVISNMRLSMVDHDNWDVEVTYKEPQRGQGSGGSNVNPEEYGPQAEDEAVDAPGEYLQLGFNVGSSQVTRLQSLRLLSQQVKPGVTPPVIYTRYRSAPMGQTREEVLGADIYQRNFSFNVTAYKTANELSFKYTRRLYRLATTLNDRPFFGFPPGSVLFLEAQAQGDILAVIPVTFEFEVRPNFIFTQSNESSLMSAAEENPLLQFDTISDPFFTKSTNLAVSTEGYYINNVWKDKTGANLFASVASVDGTQRWADIYSGWDHVDYRYTDGEVDTFGFVVKKPIMRLIHNNYHYSNFVDLQIGHL